MPLRRGGSSSRRESRRLSGSDEQDPQRDAASQGTASGISPQHLDSICTALHDLGLGDGPTSGYYNVTPARLTEIHLRVLEGLATGQITLRTEEQIESIRVLLHLAGTKVNGCGVKLTLIYWRDPGPDPLDSAESMGGASVRTRTREP
jgi:hypothetical protein